MGDILKQFADTGVPELGEALSDPHTNPKAYMHIWVGGRVIDGPVHTEAAFVAYDYTHQGRRMVAFGGSLDRKFAPFASAMKLCTDYDTSISKVQDWAVEREWGAEEGLWLQGISQKLPDLVCSRNLRTVASIMLLSSVDTGERATAIAVPEVAVDNIFKAASDIPTGGAQKLIDAAEGLRPIVSGQNHAQEERLPLALLFGSVMMPPASVPRQMMTTLSQNHSVQLVEGLRAAAGPEEV